VNFPTGYSCRPANAPYEVVSFGERLMELLLNLIWISLAVLAVFSFRRGRRASGQSARGSQRKALLALACGVVLLFPVISASDDLHPAQAVMEDASKKAQLTVTPLHLLRTSPSLPMLPAILTLCLMFALVVWQPWRLTALRACALDGAIVPSAGRAPPACWK
jgi:hypothetical protein